MNAPPKLVKVGRSQNNKISNNNKISLGCKPNLIVVHPVG